MTLTNPKPLGHAVGEVLTSTNVDAALVQLPYAVDGNAGGTYAPSAPIIIGGSGLRVGGVAEGIDTRILTLEDPPFFTGTPSGTGLGIGSKITLTEVSSKGTFTIASNAIEVPQAGWYAIYFACSFTTSSVTNPYTGGAFILANAAVAAYFAWSRWSATAADVFSVSGSAIVEITTPSTQKISAEVSGAGTIAITGGTQNHLHLAYLGEI
jgi:hypothetical protein